MKILCFTLSLYALFLSAVPCCYDDNCNEVIKTEQAVNHSQDHKESSCNTCSPFFTCETCSGFVLSKTGVDFEIIYFKIHKSVPIYKSQFGSDFFANIWQPPKIS